MGPSCILPILFSFYCTSKPDAYEVGLIKACSRRASPVIHYKDIGLERELGAGHSSVIYSVTVKNTYNGQNVEALLVVGRMAQ